MHMHSSGRMYSVVAPKRIALVVFGRKNPFHFPGLSLQLCQVASADPVVSYVTETRAVTSGAMNLRPLLAGVRAHESSLSASRVLEDSKDGASIAVFLPACETSFDSRPQVAKSSFLHRWTRPSRHGAYCLTR